MNQKKNDFCCGDVVKSIAGRDLNRHYLVTDRKESGGIILLALADGRGRPYNSPKHKNQKHVAYVATVTDEERKLLEAKFPDLELREVLRRYDPKYMED